MKDIRGAIRQILLNDPEVAAIVGTRIYPTILPQGITQPSVVYFLVTEISYYHMQASSNLVTARYQIDAWAQSIDTSAQLGDHCFDALSAFRGVVVYGSNSPQSDVAIQQIRHDMGRDEYDSASKMYARRRDYFVTFAEY